MKVWRGIGEETQQRGVLRRLSKMNLKMRSSTLGFICCPREAYIGFLRQTP